MSIGVALRDVIFWGGVFVSGVALYLVQRHLRRGDRWFALFLLGVTVCLGLIAELVYEVPTVGTDWRTWTYSIGLVLANAGILGIARSGMGLKRKEEL